MSRLRYESEEEKKTLKILNCFKKHNKLLLNYFMVIIQLYLKLSTNKVMEKEFQVF